MRAPSLHLGADHVRELSRRELGGIDGQEAYSPRLHVLAERDAERAGPDQEIRRALVEAEDRTALAATGGRNHELSGDGRLSRAGSSDQYGARAAVETATELSVELGHPARHRRARVHGPVFRRHETRVDLDPSVADDEVVVPADALRPAQLANPQPPALPAVPWGEVLELDDATHERLGDAGLAAFRLDVDEPPRARMPGDLVAQGKELPAVSRRILREQANLGERVEDEPRRLDPRELLEELTGDLLELDLRGAEHGVAPAVCLAGRAAAPHLVDLHPIERPAEGLRDPGQLSARLGEAQVEALLTAPGPFHEELETHRRLAGPWIALEEVERPRGQPSADDLVEAWYAAGHALVLRHRSSSRT